MEFGAAAAVARWTGQGKQVVYCMVTSGEAGIDGDGPRRVPRACARPSRSSPRASSASTQVEFLGLPDGILEYGVPLRRAIAAVGPPAPARDRDHRQLPRHAGAAGTSTRPTTSPPAGRSSTPCATPATAGSSPTSSSTGSSRGAACEQVWAAGSPARRRTASTPPTPSTRASTRCAAHRGLHRRPRLGELRPARVPRGHVPRRPASGSASRSPAPFEVFPMGWGD